MVQNAVKGWGEYLPVGPPSLQSWGRPWSRSYRPPLAGPRPPLWRPLRSLLRPGPPLPLPLSSLPLLLPPITLSRPSHPTSPSLGHVEKLLTMAGHKAVCMQLAQQHHQIHSALLLLMMMMMMMITLALRWIQNVCHQGMCSTGVM